jgi:hypothetical protein
MSLTSTASAAANRLSKLNEEGIVSRQFQEVEIICINELADRQFASCWTTIMNEGK